MLQVRKPPHLQVYDLTLLILMVFLQETINSNTICGGTTYVAWQWKANGGTTSSNTDGSITSTVQANQDAGFSIVGLYLP